MIVDVFVNDVHCAKSIYGGGKGLRAALTRAQYSFSRRLNARLDRVERFRIPRGLLNGQITIADDVFCALAACSGEVRYFRRFS